MFLLAFIHSNIRCDHSSCLDVDCLCHLSFSRNATDLIFSPITKSVFGIVLQILYGDNNIIIECLKLIKLKFWPIMACSSTPYKFRII